MKTLFQGIDGMMGEPGQPGEKGDAAIITANLINFQKGEIGPRGEPGR